MVVPMRAQPLHFGHVRLVLSLADAFHSVRLIVGNQPRSPNDPFPWEQRRKWWQLAIDVYGLERVEVVRGAHGAGDGDRVARYTGGLRSTHTALVSGNEEVRSFWAGRCPLVLDVRCLVLPVVVAPVPDERLLPREGIGSVIRGALASSGPGSVRALVPRWVWDDLVAKPPDAGGGGDGCVRY